MTNEQVTQLKVLFLEAWSNVEVPSIELHTYLTEQALSKNLIPEGESFTAEAVRKSYASIKTGDYTNYRTRPRKVKSALVVDFGNLESLDEDEQAEKQIQVGEGEQINPNAKEEIGDEDELDCEVNEEPELVSETKPYQW